MNRKYMLSGLIGAFCAFMLLVDGGCGNDAPFGSKVVGPSDASISIFTATTVHWYLTFAVLDADDKPLNGVNVKIFALNGSLPEWGGVTYYEKKTDEYGNVDVIFDISLTLEEIGGGLKSKEGYVSVSTETSGDEWKVTMTLKTS